MTPTYEVVPGDRVGPFQLGDNLWHILEIIRTHKTEYPKVEVSWDEDAPHKSAVTIHLLHLILYFPPSPLYQTLTLISIPSLRSPMASSSSPSSSGQSHSSASNITLTYETQVLYAPNQFLTRAKVGRLMGPTFVSSAGDKLDFPGIAFDLISGMTGSGGLGPREDFVEKITIMQKPDEELSPKLTSCVLQPNVGVTLALDAEQVIEIVIGQTTSQDLSLDLGPQLRKFWKEDDRLEKMWGGHSEPGGCFWNYFQYGLDFLISPQGFVSKILCHSNIPGTPLFQRYARAPWILPTQSGSLDLDLTSPISAFKQHFSPSASASTSSDGPVSKNVKQYMEEIKLTVISPPDNGNGAEGAEGKNAAMNGDAGKGSNSGSGNGKKKNGKRRNESPASGAGTGTATPSDPSPKPDGIDDKANKTSASFAIATGSKARGKDGGQQDAMMLDRLVEGGLDGVHGLGPSRLLAFEGLIIEEDEKSGGICSVLVYRDVDNDSENGPEVAN
ncbi:hypothetical protein I317_05892 [Kwoniella heveanensis CBS 569]|nr:hypothetical protein I317_05892 [Kwoniella heveanensis CBS 569]